MTTKAELTTLSAKIQMNVRDLSAQVTQLRAFIAALPDDGGDAALRCPECSLRARGPNALAEHRYVSHGGPEPAHWLEAERRASDA